MTDHETLNKQFIDRVLVTGANGFIGQHLVPLLIEAGHTCRVTYHSVGQNPLSWDENNIDIVPFDLDDKNPDYDMLLSGVDMVIHLSARVHLMEQGSQYLDIYRQTNTAGTQNLAREAARRDVRQFIYLSTAKVHGEKSEPDNNNAFHAFNETDIPNPLDAYANSKIHAEQAIKEICAHSNMAYVILRPPLVYGSGVKANFLSLLNIINKNYPLPFASVKNKRSLLYVGNLVHAIFTCIGRSEAENKTYLMGDVDISVPELIKKIAQHMQKNTMLFHCPVALLKLMAGMVGKRSMINRITDSLLVDSSCFRQELSWAPPYSLDEGIRETVSWYCNRE